MGFLDRFRKKEKKEEKSVEEVKKTSSDLELICADDKEAYESLKTTILLHPEMIKESMEEVVQKAKEFEKSEDKTRAVIQYRVAGGLAILEGNIEKVKQFFDKCQELSGKPYLILEIPERAVKKAQEYYQKHLKEEKK